MKKLLSIAAILLVPAFAFADFQIGPVVQYKTPISASSKIPGKNSLSINDFSFGADARLNLGVFQVTGYGLVTPADSAFNLPASIKLYVDGGLLLRLAIFGLGVGIGPDFIFNLDSPSNPAQVDGNIRFAGDLILNKVTVSLVYLIEANLTPIGIVKAFDNVHGQLGLSLLFKIF